jgi:hypothetical protein
MVYFALFNKLSFVDDYSAPYSASVHTALRGGGVIKHLESLDSECIASVSVDKMKSVDCHLPIQLNQTSVDVIQSVDCDLSIQLNQSSVDVIQSVDCDLPIQLNQSSISLI